MLFLIIVCCIYIYTIIRIQYDTALSLGKPTLFHGCVPVCMYVCMVITYSRVWINRVRLPILLVVN